jgi:hypothetical protein
LKTALTANIGQTVVGIVGYLFILERCYSRLGWLGAGLFLLVTAAALIARHYSTRERGR